MELSPGLDCRWYLHLKLFKPPFFLGIFTSKNIYGIYTASCGTIAGIDTLVLPPLNSRFMPSVFRPPFGTFIVTYGTIGVNQNLHCFLWNYRRYIIIDVTFIFLAIGHLSLKQLLFFRELSTIIVINTVLYGAITVTLLPAIPPFETLGPPFFGISSPLLEIFLYGTVDIG